MNGQILSDRYKIISTLGAGGMGQTFIAEDTQRPGNPKCVVKQLKPASNDPNFLVTARRLFEGEAEMLEKLGKHDQIPQLLAHFERGGEFYLVQEFIDGLPLSAELPLGQRWSEAQVVALLKDILVVLEFIHGQGVIHRDIKPDNIVRRKQDGKLVLIDFGAVKQVRMQQTTAVGQVSVTVAIGTPGYMPTEQSSGKPRPSSDLYALGMVAIQALTGLLPSQLKEDEDGEAIWRDQAEVSDSLAMVLTTMTRHYFKHRYQSTLEVLQALKDLDSPGINRDYSPTQAASGSYTPTGVASNGSGSTQANPGVRSNSGGTRQSTSSQTGQTQRVKSTTIISDPEPKPSSVSAKFLFAGACFLSALIAGGLIYFHTRPQPQSKVSPSPFPSPIDSGTKTTDSGTKTTDSGTKTTDSGTKTTDSGTKTTDSGTKTTDSGTKTTDSGTKTTDSGTKTTDSGTKTTDSGTKTTDSGTKTTDSGTKPTDSGTKTTDSGTTAREQAAREQAAREQAAREQAAREQAAREQAAREQAAREQAAREQAAREQAAREQAAREQAAREQAAREQAARETKPKKCSEFKDYTPGDPTYICDP
jgi:serine/threonine protein kinase